eukprot:gb/GFBE01075313.1/.p1 GENE.gb/GFBE01075313.1/~~gb/GFBE01075313.1/.p1  ORF type:complete len:406 (+),score=120.12 gb/GFBE01075313.1/:1-1218(+)
MMMMRDPEEVRAEAAAKAEAEHCKKAKRAAMAKTSWEHFFQYFRFADVSWIARTFYERADRDMQCVTTQDVYEVVEAWLEYRWGSDGRGSVNFKVDEELVAAAKAEAKKAGVALKDDEYSLEDAVKFCFYYQAQYLKAEKTAGWGVSDLEIFEDVFDAHRHGHEQVRATELWTILGMLGHEFPTIPEQKYLLGLVKAADADKSGSISFEELLHLLRMLQEDQKVEDRKREHMLIVRSGMSLEDCEEWLDMFLACAEDKGHILMTEFKGLFDILELKIDRDGTQQMMAWLKDVDEDSNGEIDFGEFCNLVQLMWDSNFAGICDKASSAKKEAEERMEKERAEFRAGERKPSKSREFKPRNWAIVMSQKVDEELEPHSPKCMDMIAELERTLAASREKKEKPPPEEA